jgi:putative transposase
LKITAKARLNPTAEQRQVLLRTLGVANACANWLSEEAWNRKVFAQFSLHKLLYYEARERFELSAQVVVRLFSKVADSYKLDRMCQRRFAKHGAISYDSRILSFKNESANIWTVEGRQRIPYSAGDRQKAQIRLQQGESDLIYHRGKFYLAATCNIDNPEPSEVDDFLGIDLGIVQIASESDGEQFSGSMTNNVRYRHRKLRKHLQAAQTKSAKRHLKKLAGKEFRFAQNINHSIAKTIVEKAKRTGRGIAIEKLTGIRERIRARKSQRTILHSWAFAQLGAFLKYKAIFAGVALVEVDPCNTSRECSQCGHIEKANRPSQSKFQCKSCGYTANADFNAALNLRSRAKVNRPIAA